MSLRSGLRFSLRFSLRISLRGGPRRRGRQSAERERERKRERKRKTNMGLLSLILPIRKSKISIGQFFQTIQSPSTISFLWRNMSLGMYAEQGVESAHSLFNAGKRKHIEKTWGFGVTNAILVGDSEKSWSNTRLGRNKTDWNLKREEREREKVKREVGTEKY